MACPHRVATEYGVIPAPRRNTRNPLEYVFERQFRPGVLRVILHLTICSFIIIIFSLGWELWFPLLFFVFVFYFSMICSIKVYFLHVKLSLKKHVKTFSIASLVYCMIRNF